MPTANDQNGATDTPTAATTRWWGAPLRIVYLVAGLFFVGLGWLGYIIPGLPGTVFLIMAAWCFARSSERLENWLLGLPGIGQLLRDHRAGLGMPHRTKLLVVAMITTAVSLSAGLSIDNTRVRIIVAVVGVIGVAYVWFRVPTRERVLAERAAAEGVPG